MSGTSSPQVPRHDPVELLAGLLVLALLFGLILAAVLGNGRKSHAGYMLSAQFDHVDGLDIGADVRLAGVTVGQVVTETVNARDFQAVVTMSVRPDIKLPTDSSVTVTSDSLLGGKYLSLTPGGADGVLAPGGRILQTQGSISLEALLSKFIFSVTDSMKQKPAPALPASSLPASGLPASSPSVTSPPASSTPASGQPAAQPNTVPKP